MHQFLIAIFALTVLIPAPASHAYSVLTHEAIIDSMWDSPIKELLLKRFPKGNATPVG